MDDFHLQENGQSLNSKLKDWFLARQEKGDGINRVQGQNARGLRSEIFGTMVKYWHSYVCPGEIPFGVCKAKFHWINLERLVRLDRYERLVRLDRYDRPGGIRAAPH